MEGLLQAFGKKGGRLVEEANLKTLWPACGATSELQSAANAGGGHGV